MTSAIENSPYTPEQIQVWLRGLLCKINPLYEQLVGLRFRALSYLADDCGEDITRYA